MAGGMYSKGLKANFCKGALCFFAYSKYLQYTETLIGHVAYYVFAIATGFKPKN